MRDFLQAGDAMLAMHLASGAGAAAAVLVVVLALYLMRGRAKRWMHVPMAAALSAIPVAAFLAPYVLGDAEGVMASACAGLIPDISGGFVGSLTQSQELIASTWCGRESLEAAAASPSSLVALGTAPR